MHNEVWIYTEILPLTVPYTLVQELRLHSLVFVVSFWNALVLERSAERALNLGITGAFWDMFGSLRSSASSCESKVAGDRIPATNMHEVRTTTHTDNTRNETVP